MGQPIRYLNTDLVLKCLDDLTPLATHLQSQGVAPLAVVAGDDGLWHASFETAESLTEPEQSIAAITAALELLPSPLRSIWDACKLKEFNVGYDCGDEPWAFNQGLSAGLLARIALLGASLRLTLYPEISPAAESSVTPAA